MLVSSALKISAGRLNHNWELKICYKIESGNLLTFEYSLLFHYQLSIMFVYIFIDRLEVTSENLISIFLLRFLNCTRSCISSLTDYICTIKARILMHSSYACVVMYP